MLRRRWTINLGCSPGRTSSSYVTAFNPLLQWIEESTIVGFSFCFPCFAGLWALDIRPGSEALSNVRLGMVRFKHIFSRLRDCPGTELHPEVCREEGGGKGGGGFGYPLDLCMVVNIKLKNLCSNTTMGQVVECILTEVIRMGRQPTWYQSHHPSRPDCNIETLTLAPYNKYAWGEERFLSTYVRHREV